MTLMLEGLDLLGTRPSTKDGEPMRLPLALVEEDPEQPRTEFDAAALAELADTIKTHGVLQPVSVRPHPQMPGRWMLNFGARRLRASALAGVPDIPAFVDDRPDSYAQVIENEQRAALAPMELALFVKRRLAAGDTRAEIARRLGKSAAIVTYACALIDAPDWLVAVYREGRCRGLRELYELRRAGDEAGDGVAGWVAAQPHLSRDGIAALRVSAGSKRSSDSASDAPAADHRTPPPCAAEAREGARRAGIAVVVEADFRGQRVLVQIHVAPAEPMSVYVTACNGSNRREVGLAELSNLSLSRR